MWALVATAIAGLAVPSTLAHDSSSAPMMMTAGSPGGFVAAGTVGSLAGALHWTPGQAYPSVNGRPTPPPLGLNGPQAPPPTTGGHYYAGSVFSGTSGLTTWTDAEITVPAATPSSSEFYYVILSIWDNGGSYDQIGFANDYGSWQIAYSYTTGTCAASYVYSASAGALTAGQDYLFEITAASSSYGSGVGLQVFSLSTSQTPTGVFYLHAPTGASNPGGLELAGTYCGDYDYTDYEEVYGSTSGAQPLPYLMPIGLTFFWHGNCYGATGCNTWTPWSAWHTSNAPSGTVSSIGTDHSVKELVTIQNNGPDAKGGY
jgi:hypothetical protein